MLDDAVLFDDSDVTKSRYCWKLTILSMLELERVSEPDVGERSEERTSPHFAKMSSVCSK